MPSYRTLIAWLATASLAFSANAQQFLTDNDRVDTRPVFLGKQTAWTQVDGDGYYQVMLYDGKTTRALTNGAINNAYLTSGGKFLAWIRDTEVMLWDGKTARSINSSADTQYNPHTDGKWVVWEHAVGGGDREIMLWDGTTVTQITSNVLQDYAPKVHRNRIVWYQADGDNEIMLWEDGATWALTNNATNDRFPQIEGDSIVWQGRDGSDNVVVMLHDGETTTQISTTHGDLSFTTPLINKQCVVWTADDALGGDFEIFLWRKGVVTQITDNNTADYFPVNAGPKIAWLGSDGHDDEVMFYNGKGVTVRLTNNSVTETDLRYNGKSLVWVASDGEDLEIFAFPDKRKLP
jgi:hypothetical protein